MDTKLIDIFASTKSRSHAVFVMNDPQESDGSTDRGKIPSDGRFL